MESDRLVVVRFLKTGLEVVVPESAARGLVEKGLGEVVRETQTEWNGERRG